MRFYDLLDGAAGVEGLWHLGGSREMWCRVRVFESQRRGFDVAECFVLMLGLTVDVHVHMRSVRAARQHVRTGVRSSDR
jgi:hypothetical protein